ncbi:MAG TPA: T9SS type A sorting domain-containing protein [Saprospiraceae bacterium]|nr:T9SS type A sorting domain-containing protein [Saprospiraceae bacterium]HMQ81926.1 T9SS type A sorting domain-containing protein [Saprospiraceae bacterium]
MKHFILFLSLFSFLVTENRAQISLTFTPDEVETSDYIDPENLDYELIGYAKVKNESSETVSLRWERTFIQKPEGWDIQVCDLYQCYSQVVYSNVAPDLGLDAPVVLAPGEETNMDVHVKPTGSSGFAEVRIDVALASAPDDILVSGTYTFDALIASTNQTNPIPVRLYPNPTADYFQLQGDVSKVKTVVVYNVIGRQIRTYQTSVDTRFYVGDIPNGLYLVSLLDKNNRMVHTFRLNKRDSRP